MRYLFFDIECCNGRDICEFGYVITNEAFEQLEIRDITINPDKPFNLTGRVNQRDVYLHYPESEYYNSPKFTSYYDEIKQIIEYPDQIIVGHAINNDAIFLRNACNRYGLTNIDFRFNDSQKMFQEYFNVHRRVSLENAGEIFEVEKPQYSHKSDDDSLLTMRFVQKMCEKMEASLPELIDLCPSCSGKIMNGVISYDSFEKRITQWIERAKTDGCNDIKKKNIRLFRYFLDNVKSQGTIRQSDLTGKSICISMNYERTHFKEMLALIQLIANNGGKYCLKAAQNNIFVRYDNYDENGVLFPCTRLRHVEEAIRNGKSIDIITFAELLKIFGITERELVELPFPEVSAFLPQKRSKNGKNKNSNYIESKPSSGSSIGELLALQGVDLSKFK